jgi:uncharacterized membrane protein YdbT with pleckstrin-like domain
MGYIDQNLAAGEMVVYQTRLHWIVLLRPLILLFFALIGFTIFPLIGILILLFTGSISIGPLIIFFTSEFGVTNRRVIIKLGFVRRNSLELVLKEVEGILVDQDVLGRLLDYGTITIVGTGGTKQQFSTIENPIKFRQRVLEQIPHP